MYSELNNQRRFPVCEKIEAPYRLLLCPDISPFLKKKSFTSVFFFQLGLTEKKGICVVVLHSTAALVHKMTLAPAEVLQG